MIVILIGLFCILIFMTIGSAVFVGTLIYAAYDEDIRYLLPVLFAIGVMLVFGGLTYQLFLEIAKYSLGR